jgi:hypothetical protein
VLVEVTPALDKATVQRPSAHERKCR